MQTQIPLTAIPDLIISDKDVRNAQSSIPIFTIDKAVAPGSFSRGSLVTLIRVTSGLPLGTIRFRSLEEHIELTVNGRHIRMKEDGQLVATIKDNILYCESIGLTEDAVDEIVLSAVAMIIKSRKVRTDSDAVGEVVSALAGE
ncbi:hypothetical protein LTR37_019012 [Vermiconidia calcicola]|uniref:Uncharacterized protein n=1 Tax=Vermiconidia calcicola TaxID=1690605 RepID=A0ACC3MFF2_9PEZI|nr:hypothetical protein LTR37_019012 [Vermiconidia calcicola]